MREIVNIGNLDIENYRMGFCRWEIDIENYRIRFFFFFNESIVNSILILSRYLKIILLNV
jgi:hypothetical protein